MYTQGFMGWGYMRLCCHLVGSRSLIPAQICVGRRPQLIFNTFIIYSFEGYIKIHKYRRIKKTLFSTHTTLVPLVKKYQHMLTTKISQKSGILERTPRKPILKIFRAENKRFHSTAHIIPWILIMMIYRSSQQSPQRASDVGTTLKCSWN